MKWDLNNDGKFDSYARGMLSANGPATMAAGLILGVTDDNIPPRTDIAGTAYGLSRFHPPSQSIAAVLVGLLLDRPNTAIRYSMNLQKKGAGKFAGSGAIQLYPAMQINGLQPPTGNAITRIVSYEWDFD